MKYHIAKQGEEIVISFEQLDGQAQWVIDALGRCRVRAAACPAAECMKIDGMETCDQDGALAIRLKPRADSKLDVAALGECLKYHLPKDSGK